MDIYGITNMAVGIMVRMDEDAWWEMAAPLPQPRSFGYDMAFFWDQNLAKPGAPKFGL